MSIASIKKIKKLFSDLQKARREIVLPLITLTVAPYFGFIGVIAFNPNLFSKLVGSESLSIGIILGFILILHIFLVTLTYSYLANKKLEPIIRKLIKTQSM